MLLGRRLLLRLRRLLGASGSGRCHHAANVDDIRVINAGVEVDVVQAVDIEVSQAVVEIAVL